MAIKKSLTGEYLEIADLLEQLMDKVTDGSLPAKRLVSDLKDLLAGQSFQFAEMFGKITPTKSIDPKRYDTDPPPSQYHELISGGDAGLFVSAEKQIENIRRWDKSYGWNLSESTLNRCESVPAFRSAGRLETLVLVPYIGGVGETFDALWDVISEIYPEARRSSELAKRSGELMLVEGQHQGNGLVWERINLGANPGIHPTGQSGNCCPHAGILAATAHFPAWVKNMGAADTPNVWLPGYFYRHTEGALVECEAVRLGWDGGRKSLNLMTAWEGRRDRNYAVPSFIA